MTVKEIRVRIRNEDTRYQKDFLEYENFTLSEEDPVIQRCFKDLKDTVKGEMQDPQYEVIVKMVWS